MVTKDLFEKLPSDLRTEPTFLVLRQIGLPKVFKPVLGIARVLFKMANDIRVQVCEN